MIKKKLLRLIFSAIIIFSPLLLAQEQMSIDRQSQNVQQSGESDHELQFPDIKKSRLQHKQEMEKEAAEFKCFGTKMEMFWVIGGTSLL